MRSSIRSVLGLGIFALLLGSQSAAAQTNLAASMTVDNSFVAYLSTDDTVQGTQIGTGNSWPTTYSFNAALTPGVTNYLHIVATDAGPPAMFIGSFALDSIEFEFSNGTQSLVSNTANWSVSETGFGANYVTPADKGAQGTSPWGTFPAINANAHFIWNPVGPPPSTVYFSTVISPTGAQPVGTRTTFTVDKQFSDGNDETAVTVHIQCFTGLPLNQQQTFTADNDEGVSEVEFVVESFDDGELDCDIWESEVAGYSASYSAESYVAGDYGSDADGCHFESISSGTGRTYDNLCVITNEPDAVEVTVNKDWVIDGTGGDQIDPTYELWLECEDQIVGGYTNHGGGYKKELTPQYGAQTTENESYTAHVIPDWDGGTDCFVFENVYDSAVEVDNDCGGLFVEIGEGDECTITNTVFFEGIPTLSQYGMAIMALLMLGVGFVGFRRFV